MNDKLPPIPPVLREVVNTDINKSKEKLPRVVTKTSFSLINGEIVEKVTKSPPEETPEKKTIIAANPATKPLCYNLPNVIDAMFHKLMELNSQEKK